jgi:hypothetical protein
LWSMRETALSSFCKTVGMWEKYGIQKKARHFVWKLIYTNTCFLSWNMHGLRTSVNCGLVSWDSHEARLE